jgi:hypothetical protein
MLPGTARLGYRSSVRASPVAVALVFLVAGAAAGATPAEGLASQAESAGPTLRLIAASPRVTGTLQGRFLSVDPGVFVASVGGALEFRAWRADYDRPLMLAQVDPMTGMPLRSLPGRRVAFVVSAISLG